MSTYTRTVVADSDEIAVHHDPDGEGWVVIRNESRDVTVQITGTAHNLRRLARAIGDALDTVDDEYAPLRAVKS